MFSVQNLSEICQIPVAETTCKSIESFNHLILGIVQALKETHLNYAARSSSAADK